MIEHWVLLNVIREFFQFGNNMLEEIRWQRRTPTHDQSQPPRDTVSAHHHPL